MAPTGKASMVATFTAPFLDSFGNFDKRQLANGGHFLPEVENAKCECCGMSEECTPAYISDVRGRFLGRWVCGLCAEAVKEESARNGGEWEAALTAHMGVCKRFNGFERTHPVLFQAEAMRGILRKLSKSIFSPRDVKDGTAKAACTGFAHSPSCIAPVAAADVCNDRVTMKY